LPCLACRGRLVGYSRRILTTRVGFLSLLWVVTLTGCGSADEEAPALSRVTAISTGFGTNCALLDDGSVSCWGARSWGVRGEPLLGSSAPTALAGVQGMLGVSVGTSHACAVMADRSVTCWGEPPGAAQQQVPSSATPVQGLSDVLAVAASDEHTCALRTDQTVQCWGFGSSGELGSGSLNVPFDEPVSVVDVSDATAIAVSNVGSCALLADGRAKCWGVIWDEAEDAPSGEDGDDTPHLQHTGTPRLVQGLTTATSIASGSFYSCATLADTTVACWGVNAGGNFTDGTGMVSRTPVVIPDLTGVTAISAGGGHACALLNDGTVRCWGNNLSGQLGDGSQTSSLLPVPVTGIDSAIAISAGQQSTCALLADSTVRCWGWDAIRCAKTDRCIEPVPVVVRVAP